MKYLFINSVAGFGSTGKIAAEKCRELMRQGHECVLAYGRRKIGCEDIETWQIGSSLDYRLHGAMNRIFDNHGFGSASATKAFLQKVREYDPDVIWLHNIHGYYIHIGLLFSYLKTCGKQIFWTLHDCWSFTGHCSHFDYIGCDKWKAGCHSCPQKREYPASLLLDNSAGNYEKKKALFTGIPDMTLITPSHWLEGLVKESFLGEYPVEVEHNRIDLDVFRPTESDFRRKHGLQEQTMILGVASVWSPRKGLQDFVRLSEMLDSRFRIVLVGLTEDQTAALPEKILGLPRTSSAAELAQIYTAADVFVNPTYEDTYPTVNLEAKACGAAIISYDTGGCPETLGPEDTLVPRGDIGVVRDAILRRFGAL